MWNLQERADGVIDRSEMCGIPFESMASEVVRLFGTRIAETILASAHVRAREQAGHMSASDPIKISVQRPCKRGPSTYDSRLPFGGRLEPGRSQ